MVNSATDGTYDQYISDAKDIAKQKNITEKEALGELMGNLGVSDQLEAAWRHYQSTKGQGGMRPSIEQEVVAAKDVQGRRKNRQGATEATKRGPKPKARNLKQEAEDVEAAVFAANTGAYAKLKRAIKDGDARTAQALADQIRRSQRRYAFDPKAARLRNTQTFDADLNRAVAEKSMAKFEERLESLGYRDLLRKARNGGLPSPEEKAQKKVDENQVIKDAKAIGDDEGSWLSRRRKAWRNRSRFVKEPKTAESLRRQMERKGVVYNEEATVEENRDILLAYKEKKSKERRKEFYENVEHSNVVGGFFGRRPGQNNGITARVKRRAGPFGMFIGALSLMNTNVRVLVVIGLLFGLLFIPTGFFLFAGWSIAAAAMVVISMLYSVFVNLVRSVASVFLLWINGFYTFFGGIIVKVGEWVLGWFAEPRPCAEPLESVDSTFCTGREVLAEGLVPGSELNALKIKLLDPSKFQPKVESEPLIVAILRFAGAEDFSMDWLWGGLATRMQTWVETSSIYSVVFWFAVPAVVLGGLFYVKVLRPALRAYGV